MLKRPRRNASRLIRFVYLIARNPMLSRARPLCVSAAILVELPASPNAQGKSSEQRHQKFVADRPNKASLALGPGDAGRVGETAQNLAASLDQNEAVGNWFPCARVSAALR